MPQESSHFDLVSPDATARFATALARFLNPGDVILLEGDVGTGKTHFARHLIQSILITPEDVPSPTFTLVQTYNTKSGQLWHTDLYRISSTQEIEELGLMEAFETAICLVEWPDRLGTLEPDTALTLAFQQADTEEGRHVTAKWSAPVWSRRLAVWQTT